jgi:diguanylate cyclase (GGDEF)-like protein
MRSADPHAHDASDVSRALAQGYRLLRFAHPLEDEFRDSHRTSVRRWVRVGLYVAVAASLSSALLDPWIVSAPADVPKVVRFGVQLPVLLLLLFSSHERFYARWYELAIQLGAPIFAIGTIVVASYSQPPYQALVGARLLLVCFYVYFLAGLRMPQALRANLVMLAALIAAGIVEMLAAELTTFLAFALASANVIGAAGAYALEHARRTAFLERKLLIEVAELDGLTGLMNRHTFDARARDAWRSALAAQRPATILMIDVDHFKLYNDHYGHQSGDDCLRRVASSVRKALSLRPGDLIARYGGEEIVVLLFERKAADVHELAQRIVADVNALGLPHAAAPANQVSVSVGAAAHGPPLIGAYDTLLRQADAALYAAKHQGRNRAIVVEARASAAA